MQPEWRPDYGLPEFIPSWGATIVGARKFLIAYNINMLSTKEQAHRIALNVREQGRSKEQVSDLDLRETQHLSDLDLFDFNRFSSGGLFE